MRTPRPRALMLLLAATLVAGCAVTLISPYDAETDRGVTELQKSVETLLTRLDASPVPAYETVKPVYDGIRTDLGALRLRNEARPKNELTVKQLDIVKGQLATLETQHRDGRLVQPMIAPAETILNQTFLAILKLELAKKEAK